MASDERQETVDAILAEMRYAPIPKHDRDIELLRMFANRLEAALKRERAEHTCECGEIAVLAIKEAEKPQGNAAALLEALRALRDASRNFYNQILNSKYSGILDKYTCVKQGFPAVLDLRSAFPMANYALAAPPRNCDAMPWRKAWDGWRAKHHPQNPQTFNESYEATVAFMEWFTAPASEKGATA